MENDKERSWEHAEVIGCLSYTVPDESVYVMYVGYLLRIVGGPDQQLIKIYVRLTKYIVLVLLWCLGFQVIGAKLASKERDFCFYCSYIICQQ